MKKISKMWAYIADIPWLIFSREPRWSDAEECERIYCSYCGGRWFNYKNEKELELNEKQRQGLKKLVDDDQ